MFQREIHDLNLARVARLVRLISRSGVSALQMQSKHFASVQSLSSESCRGDE